MNTGLLLWGHFYTSKLDCAKKRNMFGFFNCQSLASWLGLDQKSNQKSQTFNMNMQDYTRVATVPFLMVGLQKQLKLCSP